MKIIDCFLFYNEIDLLNYRMNLLNDVVDYFVIVESKYTFAGKEKKIYLKENKHLFEKFKDKMIPIVANNAPFKYTEISMDNNKQWVNEVYQRNAIQIGLENISLDPEDAIIITDIDEIIDPALLWEFKNKEIPLDIYSLEFDMYYYNLNTKLAEKWYIPKILSFQKYKELNIPIDNIRISNHPILRKSGWHLSYFGNADSIINKIESFSHQELNTEYFKNKERITERIQKSEDLFDRKENTITYIPISENDYLPVAYDIYLTKYFTT
jgi:beta-1,4-mannosyl-glycoprotein beta-1,4-N-acetylglucosaminyltransferase